MEEVYCSSSREGALSLFLFFYLANLPPPPPPKKLGEVRPDTRNPKETLHTRPPSLSLSERVCITWLRGKLSLKFFLMNGKFCFDLPAVQCATIINRKDKTTTKWDTTVQRIFKLKLISIVFFCFVVFMRENVSADYRKNTLKYIINFSTAHSSATISLL